MEQQHIFRSIARQIAIILVLIALLSLASCFHKDVMTDRADDINMSLLYRGREGSFIINKETIFQASSKSSRRGMTSISGHNDYRISSYDLATGKLVARVNMKGGMQDGEFNLLGVTDGRLWVYSMNKDLGLHCRNPKTLEVIASQQKLTENLSFKAITLANAPWAQISRYFSFDWVAGEPVMTDIQGYKYLLHPDSYTPEKTDKKLQADFSKNYFSSYCQLGGYSLQLAGNNHRVSPKLGYNDQRNTDISFLFGNIIMDRNDSRSGQSRKKHAESVAATIRLLQDSISTYERTHTASAHDYSDAYYRYRSQKGLLSRAQSDLTYPDRWSTDKIALSDEPMTFLVYQAANISDSSRVVISKIRMNADSSFTEVWKCGMNDFYYDPAKVRRSSSFKTVFSKGDPSYRFQSFDMSDHKLIVISQLRMASIDMLTGKLIWSVDI